MDILMIEDEMWIIPKNTYDGILLGILSQKTGLDILNLGVDGVDHKALYIPIMGIKYSPTLNNNFIA